MSSFSQADYQWMQRAINLAQQGQLTTRPNPNVGCVVLNAAGQCVGEGWHQQAGQPHAEVYALEMAGEQAKGGTLYVTLEPCSHFGKTPPCADRVIASGVAKVVVSMQDPNPLVSGKGITRIQAAGIEVVSGLLAQSSAKLNPGFIQRMQMGRPKVTLKMAQSLDGKIALSNRVSQWITGPQAREDVQRYRAMHDAILTGGGTAVTDNPSLNVRQNELGHWANKRVMQPLRVVLDGKNQITQPLKLFSLEGQTLVFNAQPNPFLSLQEVEQVSLPNAAGRVDLPRMLDELGQRQINSVWVECGAQLAGALLSEKCVDELIIYQAPKLLGSHGLSSFHLSDFQAMNEIISLDVTQYRQVGDDLKIIATPIYS